MFLSQDESSAMNGDKRTKKWLEESRDNNSREEYIGNPREQKRSSKSHSCFLIRRESLGFLDNEEDLRWDTLLDDVMTRSARRMEETTREQRRMSCRRSLYSSSMVTMKGSQGMLVRVSRTFTTSTHDDERTTVLHRNYTRTRTIVSWKLVFLVEGIEVTKLLFKILASLGK